MHKDRETFMYGKKGVKYGVYNTMKKEFQFGVCEDSPMLAEARLHYLIGDDAKKWRFEFRPLPKEVLESEDLISRCGGLIVSREDFDGIKEYAKNLHNERVAKNPDRVAYAIEQFEKHGIEYSLKNAQTGHFHCRRKSDDKLFQFYAGTGKIQGHEIARGIHALIKILTKE